MKKVFKHAFGLLNKTWKILFLMEIIYRFAESIIIIPFCNWILDLSLKYTGINYISLENMLDVIKNPINDLTLLLILAILAFYMLFEISYIILIFNQAESNEEMGVKQLIKESSKRAIKVLKPSNWYLILFIMLIVPFADFFSLSNMINTVKIPYFISENTINIYPWNIVFTCFIIYLIFFIFPRLLSLFYFVLEEDNIKEASDKSIKLFKGHGIKSFLLLILFYLIIILLSGLLSTSVTLLGDIIINAIPYDTAKRYLLVSFNQSIDVIFKFFIDGMAVFANYAFLSSYYFYESKERNETIAQPIKSTKKNAHKRNSRLLAIFTLLILLTYMSLTALSAFIIEYANIDDSFYVTSNIKVVGHRGNAVDAPENTLPAFQKAIDLGADYVELDVQETKDGVIVVTHDSNFKRCTGYDGNVWEMTYDQIKELDAGMESKFGDTYKGTKIPTLDEVIKLCKGKVKLLIELKTNGHDVALAERTLKVVEDNDAFDDIMIHSLSYDELKKVKEIKPSVKCGYIMTLAIGNYKDLTATDFFTIETTSVTSDAVESIHNAGKQVYEWTVDEDEDIEHAIDTNVDGIITNNVTEVKSKLKEEDNIFVETYKAFLKK
jgi:glycerophosphoryl diester phosphodiesterase